MEEVCLAFTGTGGVEKPALFGDNFLYEFEKLCLGWNLKSLTLHLYYG